MGRGGEGGLFSWKNKKNIINFSSVEFAQRVVKVNSDVLEITNVCSVLLGSNQDLNHSVSDFKLKHHFASVEYPNSRMGESTSENQG